MKFIVLTGRILFSLIFIMAVFAHFKEETIHYGASHGVMMPGMIIPAAGILATLGGLSVALGYKARIGAWFIVAFLVPVTFIMHNFWAIDEPMQHQIQMAMFMKNCSMLGGALLIAYFGAGPLSIDESMKDKKEDQRKV
jgi:putative oxidoreductase